MFNLGLRIRIYVLILLLSPYDLIFLKILDNIVNVNHNSSRSYDNMDMIDIGKNIKNLRKEKNMSSQELANIVGISRSQISKIETNSSNPSIDVLIKIARALDCTVSVIIGESQLLIPPEIKSLIEASDFLTPNEINMLTNFLKSIRSKQSDK